MIIIEKVFLKPLRSVLTRPFFLGTETLLERDAIIVQLMDRNGLTGEGEAAPLPGASRESFQSARHQLKCLEKEWLGRSLPDSCSELCARLEKDLDRSVLHSSVVFALESAILSLAAKNRGISVAEFLGGVLPATVESACLVQGDVAAVRRDGARYTAEGFSTFKLKVGSRNIPLDVQKVEALRDIIGLNKRIRLDANAAWTLDEAVAFAGGIGKSQIDFIEEPCREEKDYETFFQRSDMSWAIEAHAIKRALPDWEGARGLSAVIIKPMLSGGIMRFLEADRTIRAIGARSVISSVFESAVGLKMLANLAALSGETCGLGTVDWFDRSTIDLFDKSGTMLSARLV